MSTCWRILEKQLITFNNGQSRNVTDVDGEYNSLKNAKNRAILISKSGESVLLELWFARRKFRDANLRSSISFVSHDLKSCRIFQEERPNSFHAWSQMQTRCYTFHCRHLFLMSIFSIKFCCLSQYNSIHNWYKMLYLLSRNSFSLR